MSGSFSELSDAFFLLTFVCVLAAGVVQILFYLLIFQKLNQNNTVTQSLNKDKLLSISVVICARNEAVHLQQYLTSVLTQQYDGIFEVIVVNDDSSDATEKILFDFLNYYPHLRIINIFNKKKFHIGKKNALSKGIEAAQYDYLLLTDADCAPNSEYWLHDMVMGLYTKNTAPTYEIVLGYAPFYKKEGFLNLFCRFECVHTALRYMSFARAGVPYMGVGRNLLYKKSLYYEANGFKKHEHIASGDDDLFINAVANRKNTTILTTTTTFVYSETPPTLRAYYRQKRRHYSTGRHYEWLHKVLLGAESLTHVTFIIGGFLLCISKFSTIFVGIYLVRIGVVLYIYEGVVKKLRENDLLKYILLFDILLVVHYLVFAPVLFIGKTKQWK
jgi:poly-beta-1,6-N-acetyl-D-glucosamine synthase